MKQIKHMILLCLFCLTGMAAQAQEEGPASNEIWYTATSQVTPINILGTGGAELTPDKNEFDESAGCWKITFSGDVITIGPSAFQDCPDLTSIEIPASVTEIGEWAFAETALTSIEIPASVETIGDKAFNYCSSLETVTFAEGSQLSEIGGWAFCMCTELSSITIPASVETIGDEAFNCCFSLETVTFAEGSQLSEIGKSAFAETALISITIPASVETIGDEAFNKCSSLDTVTFAEGSQLSEIGKSAFAETALTSIEIPASVTEIGESAFENCSYLTSIEIPASVTKIGRWAFQWCTSLETVTFAEDSQLSEIGEFAFSMCTELSSITIPASVKTIGYGAFKETALTSIEIPASVETIYGEAFNSCSSLETVTFAEGSQLSEILECTFAETALTSIEIPASVTSIAYDAFSKCQGLASITVANGNEVYESPDNCNAIIDKDSKALIIGCQNTIIPNTVESIGPSAFQDCPDLTSIEIPASVTEIGSGAFNNCSSLETVTFAEGSQLSEIGESAFQDCSSLETIDFAECPQLSEIGGWAFAETALTSIEIPASVTSIGEYAFWYAGNLASVTVHWTESLPYIGEDAFSYINEEAVLNVPFGTVAKYSEESAFMDYFAEIKSAFELSVSSAGWASMYLPCAVTIPSDAEVEVYYASAASGNTITLSKVEEIIPAETGVIVKAEEGTVEFAETAEAGTPIVGNLFKGLLADDDYSEKVYVLSGASAEGTPLFQEYEGDQLNAFKAYLPKSAVSGVDEIKFRFDEATGIESLTPALSEGEGAIYNLNGVRVDGSYSGIVIRNGKKMFNK